MLFEDFDHFRSIPWCAHLLNQPNTIPVGPRSNRDLFIQNVSNQTCVQKSAFFYRKPKPSDPSFNYEGYIFLQVGEGACGQLNIAHGGFLATIMDEVTGRLIVCSKIDGGRGVFTVKLNMQYHRPVYVPGVLVAVSKVVRVEGRKVFIEAAIKDEKGQLCTSAEVIFVIKRDEKC